MTPAQLSIFDAPLVGAVRKKDPRSSAEAAATCDAQRQRDQIMRLLEASVEGMTADQLAEQMHPSPHRSSVSSRLAQLASKEWGRQTYTFGFRPNDSGRNVQVWFASFRPREVDVPTGEYL